MNGRVVTEGVVDEFLRRTQFTGYQGVPLPFGRQVPGRDRSESIRPALREVGGKDILDVGCYYGALLVEALSMGAHGAVGIEPEMARYSVAREIAELHGGRYEVLNKGLDEMEEDSSFDVVICLNVLHHFRDPLLR